MFTGLFIDSIIISPYVEHAKSELVWDIAAGPSEYFSPNILSELHYNDVKHTGLGIHLAQLKPIANNLAFYGELRYSDTNISSGRSQDSDYLANNREAEFSRSYADIKNNGNNNFSISLGLKKRWFDVSGHYFTAMIGYQNTKFDLTATNGVQAIPDELNGEVFPGLESTYNSDFNSLYFSLSTEHVFQWGTVGLRLDRYDIDFEAVADWNLREDLAHPKSFLHSGNGKGDSFTLEYSYQLNINWDTFLNFKRLRYKIKNGYDQTFFADGASYVTTLNRLSYESDQFNFGIRYIF